MVAEAGGKTPAVILPGYVSDNQLRGFYAHASGFVLPSLLEGVGLPAAEAISRGLVPLLGRGRALHELAGDSAILVDPLNTDEIADGMRLLAHIGQEDRQARLPELRLRIARFFTKFGGDALALHITTSARAVIVRATVFTWVSPQSRADGSSSSFHLPRPGSSGGGILAGPRGRIARRHAGVVFPVPRGRTGAAR
ncbi:MAG: glycosyltransferase [Methylocella sp.]